MTQRFRAALFRSDEGVAVSVSGLPGCRSQGSDEEESLENIKDAFLAYLAVADEQLEGAEIRRSKSLSAGRRALNPRVGIV